MRPKITLVTPSYNQARFLERTILSIINQDYKNLEFIVVDGGSTDGSVDIIKKYSAHITYWVSEKDKGMYDAINKGFQKSTGEIMGWLNSDDILFPNALESIADVFESFKNVEWITGLPVSIDEHDRIVGFSSLQPWSHRRVLSGSFQWIQQESTYWRRSLWQKAGSKVSTEYDLAGDFELWMRFFNYGKLISVKIGIAAFRNRQANQKSLEGGGKYIVEAKQIIKGANQQMPLVERIRILAIKGLRKCHEHFGGIGLSSILKSLLKYLQGPQKMIVVDRSTGKLKEKDV